MTGRTQATERVVEAVCAQLMVAPEDVFGRCRTKSTATARIVAMFVLRSHQVPQPSFPELGREFGRDHTTVISACRHGAKLVARDRFLADLVELGRRALEQAREDIRERQLLAKTSRRAELARQLRELDEQIGAYAQGAAE